MAQTRCQRKEVPTPKTMDIRGYITKITPLAAGLPCRKQLQEGRPLLKTQVSGRKAKAHTNRNSDIEKANHDIVSIVSQRHALLPRVVTYVIAKSYLGMHDGTSYFDCMNQAHRASS